MIGAAYDWDNITDPGIYKVQCGSFQSGKHTPIDNGIDIYAYGLLLVFRSLQDSENRGVQIYIPDTITSGISRRIAYRVRNLEYRQWLFFNALNEES